MGAPSLYTNKALKTNSNETGDGGSINIGSTSRRIVVGGWLRIDDSNRCFFHVSCPSRTFPPAETLKGGQYEY